MKEIEKKNQAVKTIEILKLVILKKLLLAFTWRYMKKVTRTFSIWIRKQASSNDIIETSKLSSLLKILVKYHECNWYVLFRFFLPFLKSRRSIMLCFPVCCKSKLISVIHFSFTDIVLHLFYLANIFFDITNITLTYLRMLSQIFWMITISFDEINCVIDACFFNSDLRQCNSTFWSKQRFQMTIDLGSDYYCSSW